MASQFTGAAHRQGRSHVPPSIRRTARWMMSLSISRTPDRIRRALDRCRARNTTIRWPWTFADATSAFARRGRR
jgi:hypothetical protein